MQPAYIIGHDIVSVETYKELEPRYFDYEERFRVCHYVMR